MEITLESEAIQDIRNLVLGAESRAVTETVSLPGNTPLLYSVQRGERGPELGGVIAPPTPDLFRLSSLTGLLDLVEALVAGPLKSAHPTDYAVHVLNHATVSILPTTADAWGRRPILATASHQQPMAFEFNKYYDDLQRFIIGLQIQFLITDPLLSLIKIASCLKSGEEIQTKDDGFTQVITLKVGEVNTGEKVVDPRMKLIPIRTFGEVNPSETEFLVRFKRSNQLPTIAIFDCEGGKWQHDSMLAIKKYLDGEIQTRKLPPFHVIA